MIEQERLGRIVLYRISDDARARVAALDQGRQEQARQLAVGEINAPTAQPIGNPVRRGDMFPMLITKDWGNGLVNGTLFLDGECTLCMTSVKEGYGDGEFLVLMEPGDRVLGR